MSVRVNPEAGPAGDAGGPDGEMLRRLDAALARALPGPALPQGFQARLMARVLQESHRDREAQRRQLQSQHADELRRLRAGHARDRRETLAIVGAAGFAAGAALVALLPALKDWTGWDAAWILPALAALCGIAIGAGVWLQRRGRLRLF